MATGKGAVSARDFMPGTLSMSALRRASSGCRGCPLYKRGTQTVFGEGRPSARLVLVGEMPGDGEDRAGRPFVGPAGRLLDRALDEVEIPREDAYVTNVVKHFKWEPRGRRRLHRTPSASEVNACLPWLDAEIELVKPDVLVCLGATASKAVLGKDVRVSRQRGTPIPSDRAPYATATVHPSSILRSREDAARRLEMRRFVADLETVARILSRG